MDAGLCVCVLFRITVRNYNTGDAFACDLDEIKLHLPRMQCKGEALGKWRLNLDYFFHG